MSLKTIGVIGAGVMGAGVAQNMGQAGFDVILIDVSDSILAQAKDRIKQNLRFRWLMKKEEAEGPTSDVLKRIFFTEDYTSLKRADYIVENTTENWGIKQEVYNKIDSICSEHCIFAANTSAIPITRIASVTKRAERVIGIHFMNPVPMKKTVEVIRGYHTSETTIETTGALLSKMGKQWVIVGDSPGFVSNRVLMVTINEAVYLAAEGVAAPEQIDKIFRECFGHKMGPLETADLIGLDTILFSIEVLYESFSDSKYRPCHLLKTMVDAGLLGRKSGRGFYIYGPSN